MKKLANYLILIVFALILVAMSTRLFPHPANFTPIIAIALFAVLCLVKMVCFYSSYVYYVTKRLNNWFS